jgi:uncharacterized protein YjbI with pentapeptide repeats
MDKKYKIKLGNKLTALEGVKWAFNERSKLWLPPLSPEDQKKLRRLEKRPFTQRMGLKGKTFWDFIQLLLIPLMLAGFGYWFTARQNTVNHQIALEQQRQTTLNSCLDDLKNLLLNQGLKTSEPGSVVRTVARAEVLSTLHQVDGERKGMIVQFLSEAQLITKLEKGVIVDLSDADLRGADLGGDNMYGADLSHANLSGTDLRGADLDGAELANADLSNADLSNAHLRSADLVSADLSNDNLSKTDLSNAVLGKANLKGDDLRSTNLVGADLGSADLTGATIGNAQLQQVKSLKGTIMPDESVHP